jgi:hypothetical protein
MHTQNGRISADLKKRSGAVLGLKFNLNVQFAELPPSVSSKHRDPRGIKPPQFPRARAPSSTTSDLLVLKEGSGVCEPTMIFTTASIKFITSTKFALIQVFHQKLCLAAITV